MVVLGEMLFLRSEVPLYRVLARLTGFAFWLLG